MGKHDDIVTPHWVNQHGERCAVWEDRRKAWADLASDPTNEEVAGRVRELDHGRNAERDSCTCGFFDPPALSFGPPLGEEPYKAHPLVLEALALAQAVDGFVARVASDTGTHDGEPRSDQWSEGAWLNAMNFRAQAQHLRDLADLWDRG